MSGKNNSRNSRRWKVLLSVAAMVALVLWLGVGIGLQGQVTGGTSESQVFTPAHARISEAVRHFFGFRPDRPQPVAFVHSRHVNEAQMECVDCHVTVTRGPIAGIPDIRTCWGCHVNLQTDHAEAEKLRAYEERGEDIPWERVYGWNEEAHVRFNHAPHIRASVECATCHGDVASMGVAERVVTHSMGFCIECHKERQASNECTTCHF